MKVWKEELLDLIGFRFWPSKHDDPQIKGPQPRIAMREVYEQLMQMRDGASSVGVPEGVQRSDG